MKSPAALSSDEAFVDVPLRDRFFQSSAFYPMPIVLISTRAPDGQTNLAPYSLCFPHVTGDTHALILITRGLTKTAANIERLGRCTVNFIPDEPALLANVKVLGEPSSTAEKMAKSVFTLIDAGGEEASDEGPCATVGEAVQALECRWDPSHPHERGGEERQYVLRVERVRMKGRWREALDTGRGLPRLPVDYGFQRATSAWMTRPRVDVSGPRLRPKFEIVSFRAPGEVVTCFRDALERPHAPVTGRIAGEHIQLSIPKERRRFWTPMMELHVEEHDEGSLIRGRIGPQPQVWQMFTGLHLLVAFSGIGGLMYGISQALTDSSPWALWAVPIALFLHAFIAGGAFIGQGLGAEGTYQLRAFTDEVLGG